MLRAFITLCRHGPTAVLWRMRSHLGSPPGYGEWILEFDKVTPRRRRRMRRRLANLRNRPRFSLTTGVAGLDTTALDRLVRAMRAQVYPDWELLLTVGPGAAPDLKAWFRARGDDPRIRLIPAAADGEADLANAALEAATGQYLVVCPPNYTPSEQALFTMAARLETAPDTQMIYWDEDEVETSGERRHPWFKPDWNPDGHLARDLLAGAGAFDVAAARNCGGFRPAYDASSVFDLSLRLVEQQDEARIVHLPHVLFHRLACGQGAKEAERLEARRRAVSDHLQRRGVTGEVHIEPDHGALRVQYPVNRPEPLVSIIIPTTDRLDLLDPCVTSVLGQTDYPALEVIIVDCASRTPKALKWLADIVRDPRVRVIQREGRFNYSAANNLAARDAKGEILLLLNNDTAVLEPHWLTEMVGQLSRPEVGAVGAKLLYPNGKIQHAGVCFEDGGPDHIGVGLTATDSGYRGFAVTTQNMSAVTGACLAVRRSTYLQVGGLEERLRIAFNDIDLCLKIGQLGKLIVWTPNALLIHYESATRGADKSLRRRVEAFVESNRIRLRWRKFLYADPFHNPNICRWNGQAQPGGLPSPLGGSGYILAFPPRVSPP
jgi:O-antigen biosynthesis protein